MGLTLAESIAKSTHARIVLVGRSASRSSSDAERIKKIRAIEESGAEVLIVAGDVCDPDAMRRGADQVHARFGPINGIIHTAGILDDAPLLEKDRIGAARVLAPKVRGTLVLDSVFQQDPLDFFVVTSSVSSIVAPAGQLDYTAANAFLDSFAKSRSQERTRYISIQWPRWTDIGMAADEPGGRTDAIHPLLGHKTAERAGLTTYSSTLSLANDWIVNEHRLNGGTGLFPATGYLEMVRAAFKDLTGAESLSISDFYVSKPLRVQTDSSQHLRLQMRKEGAGYRFSAQARPDHSHGWVECASGEAFASDPQSRSVRLNLDSTRDKCNDRILGLDHLPRNEGQERNIKFGARWRNLEKVWLGRGELLSSVELSPEFASEAETYRLHPALLDMATGSAMFLIKGNETAKHLYVPVSYGSVKIFGPLPAACFSYVRAKSGASIDSPLATFDISIVDREGKVVVEIGDFAVRQIRDLSLLESTADELGRADGDERQQAAQVSDGISSQEGAGAFERLIANSSASSVVVFPSDFSSYVEGTKLRYLPTPEKPQAVEAADSDDDVAITLTRWWKELLGVDKVGIRDDFFDLGGQSLTGVRLLAKVKKKYGVDLKLATLFSAPTIEKLCAVVDNRKAEAPEFHSLIPIRPSGTKPILFLIHEIEGSVIVFRDLVKHLDQDQPLWGVEYSAGESSSPFLKMEDLAAHYLEEIRKLQPAGPYYFLGYSFGGLLAFEMSQQLQAAGQQVKMLGMLDTFLMNGVRAAEQKRTMIGSLKRKVLSLCRHAGRLAFGPDRRSYLTEDVAERVDATIGQGRQFIYGILKARGRSIPKFLLRAKDINWFAARRYQALFYPGRITLFRAITPLKYLDMPTDRELGWGPLAGRGVEVREIPGTHREIMREPNVTVLAREVSASLAEARARQLNDSELPISERTAPRLDSSRLRKADKVPAFGNTQSA
jgi:thioesterase domain-containing protein/NAD(P)-dependent dehydrogenase (short-subunit alcohol dehydrogenase family)/acyl carrier protein